IAYHEIADILARWCGRRSGYVHSLVLRLTARFTPSFLHCEVASGLYWRRVKRTMAYAIDEIRSDDRATSRIGSAGPIASWSRGCRAPRACHPVARRRGYLFEHYGQDRLQLPDDRALEASLRGG